MTDIHAIIAAAQGDHVDDYLMGQCPRCRAMDLLSDHAIAMAEALEKIADADYRGNPSTESRIARECLAKVVKEANRG